MFYRYLLTTPASVHTGDSVAFFLPRFPRAYERTVQEAYFSKEGLLTQLLFTAGDHLEITHFPDGKMTAEYRSANRAFSSPVQSLKIQSLLAAAS